MISIVVCSANKELFDQFEKDVQHTIGVVFEIVRIDNTDKKYSICEAYNIGKIKSRYNIICFCHEDVGFETMNWGRILVEILNNQNIGLVGVQGACYLSLFPVTWVDPLECEGQFIEGLHPEKPKRAFRRFPVFPLAEVVATDGFFMASRKRVIDKVRFSDDLLNDFHGYDFDICMQIRENYKIVITRDILLSHSSGGGMNNRYFDAVRILAKKWRHRLPAYVPAYTKTEIQQLNWKALQVFHEGRTYKKFSLADYIVAARYAYRNQLLISWLFNITRL